VVVESVHVPVSFSHVHIPDLSQLLVVDIHLHLSKQKTKFNQLTKSPFFQTANPCIFIIKKKSVFSIMPITLRPISISIEN
jgi:hypothetical protein